MADLDVPSESEVINETSESIQTNSDDFERPLKRAKKDDVNYVEKKKRMDRLENRLGGILCCAVCLDLPNSAVYQVIYFCYYFLTPFLLLMVWLLWFANVLLNFQLQLLPLRLNDIFVTSNYNFCNFSNICQFLFFICQLLSKEKIMTSI